MDTQMEIQRLIVQHCRFCAEEKKEDDLIDISNDKETLKLHTIMEYFKIDFIDFNNVDLPKTTCVQCYNKIIDSYTLFETIRDSQIALFELYCLKKENFKETSNDDDKKEIVTVRSRTDSIVSNTSYQDDKSTGNQSSEEFDHKSSTELESKDKSIPIFNGISICLSNPSCYGTTNTSLTNVESTSGDSQNLISKSDDTLNTDNILETIRSPENENKGTACVNNINSNIDKVSWNIYRWCCNNCGMECDSMEDVRAHGLQLHKRCYAFKCVDCNGLIYPSFDCFIEHVRQHRNELRFYCPHCDERFQTVVDCLEHTSAHVSNGKRICRECGKLFPDENALKLHKTLSRRAVVPRNLKIPREVTSARNLRRIYGDNWEHVDLGTWDDYRWTCQECSLPCSSVQALREHAQEIHGICFAMKCADCPWEATTFRVFSNHVSRHHPHLSIICPYCNERMNDRESIMKHIKEEHFAGSQKPCDGCGQIFENKQQENQHYKQFNPVRLTRHLTTEDLTCDVCNKAFKNYTLFRYHKKKHDKNRKKEHVCDKCGKQFYVKNTLYNHNLQCHGVEKSYSCKVCDKSFSMRISLKAHVLTHLRRQQKFLCDHCGKEYNRKGVLSQHILVNHIDVNKKYKCQVCCKTFKTSAYLKSHMNIHDAGRRYQCQNCEKSFTNWGNCNKHMIRIHKTTLAKTKQTSQGRIPIDKVEKFSINIKAQVNKKWMEDLVKNEKCKLKQINELSRKKNQVIE